MYCPTCRSEYRPGFTRCATCDVDLVPDLDAAKAAGAGRETAAAAEPRIPSGAVNYCGFLALDDARDAREQLRGHGIPSEILIRDPHGLDPTGHAEEEFWIRIAPEDVKAAADVLGYHAPDEAEEGEILCSACGHVVAADDEQCSRCGARFEG